MPAAMEEHDRRCQIRLHQVRPVDPHGQVVARGAIDHGISDHAHRGAVLVTFARHLVHLRARLFGRELVGRADAGGGGAFDQRNNLWVKRHIRLLTRGPIAT
jgi:hypothetical protein